jgi:hypothetical protein
MDHWYLSHGVWEVTGCPPGAAFPDDLDDAASWYPDMLVVADPQRRPKE